MKVFGVYAGYYNLLYQDKDYRSEVEYIYSLIDRHAPGSVSVLELGCGTGKHALLLARKGLEVHGIDTSQDMLGQARKQIGGATDEIAASRVSLEQGDVRTWRCDQKFDVTLSLFHVMSYQTTNQDLYAAFSTASAHLKQGGVFIFDCWYGPAVLAERPAVRVKRLENDEIQVIRIAEPDLYPNENRVDVNYHVFIRNKATEDVNEIKEKHSMRYLFYPEIEKLLADVGMSILVAEEWMSGREPGLDTWGVCFVAQKTI